MPNSTIRTLVVAVAAMLVAPAMAPAKDFAAPALSGDRAEKGLMVEEPPRYGVFYDDREPTFYTGFAPRTEDPTRLHIHLGRGNQLRVTAVLSDEVLREYARDLAERRRIYRKLVDDGRVVLSQNRSFEDFEHRLDEAGVAAMVKEESALAPSVVRERNLALLELLNPGRVFRITMSLDALAGQWMRQLTDADRTRMDADRRLVLLNALLPTRLWIAEMPNGVTTALDDLVRRAPRDGSDPTAVAAFTSAYAALLTRVSDGRYPVRDGVVAFDEFTAIYPVGSVAQYTTWRGRQIPLYPTPGRRAITNHQRSLTADHIPVDESYSYSPWLPYMHVTPTMHNSIHTPWWWMRADEAKFLPASWRNVISGSRDGTPFERLWLLSRGPMSHGCTHLNTGHISELRQMLPAESDRLYEVDVFLARSENYDVFDIDGDMTPEVMGVKYFIAYSLIAGKPDRLRVRNERHAFYDWLYGGDLRFDGERGYFTDIRDARFVERTAKEGRSYGRAWLREADYQPETVQFYRRVDIPFVRALRQVGVDQPADELFARRQEAKASVMRATIEGDAPRSRRRARRQ